MAVTPYNAFLAGLPRGTFDLDTGGDTIRALLLTAASDINPDDADVTTVLGRAGTTEVTGGSYARVTLSSQAVTQDDTDNEGVFDASDIVFTGVAVGQDPVGLLLYKFVTDDDGSTPICYIDNFSGLPLTADGGNVTITWPSEGILNFNAA